MDLNWHFLATSHGKGVVDALGGTAKRLVYRAVLGGQQCASAAEFVLICQSKTTAIEINELTQSDIDASKIQMEPIFQSLKTVPETKKIHSVKALNNNSIEYRFYSTSSKKKIFRF